MTLLFLLPAPAFWAEYKISPLSVLSFANCAPALGRGIGQAPIIAAYRRALPLLVWIYELPFFCSLLREESPAPAFWRNIKSARYRYGFLQGSPFQVGYHSPPFRAGVGANTDPHRPLQGQAQAAPPLFAGCRTFSACIKAAAGRAPVYCKAQVAAEGDAAGVSPCGRNRRRSRRARPPRRGAGCLRRPRRVCTRPGSQPLPQQPQKLRPGHPAQGTVPDPVRQHHRQLLALPLFIRP